MFLRVMIKLVFSCLLPTLFSGQWKRSAFADNRSFMRYGTLRSSFKNPSVSVSILLTSASPVSFFFLFLPFWQIISLFCLSFFIIIIFYFCPSPPALFWGLRVTGNVFVFFAVILLLLFYVPPPPPNQNHKKRFGF